MSNKPTIFGEESFIVSNMAEQFYHKEMEFRDDILFGRIACDFNLDKEKVKRQLELCNKLEDIDKTDLIYMATKKKFADKDYEIKVLQKAIEFLAEEFIDYEQSLIEECIIEGGILTDSGYETAKKFLIDKSKFKAKEMLENE